MPRIISELHGLALISWVTTAYMLASTVMVPIWGKLGDLFGRKPVLLAGIVLPGGLVALGPLGRVRRPAAARRRHDPADRLPRHPGHRRRRRCSPPPSPSSPTCSRRASGQGRRMFGAVFGLSSTIGPLIGGYFTDHGTVTWLGQRSPAGAGCST
jgi:MFS family permease